MRPPARRRRPLAGIFLLASLIAGGGLRPALATAAPPAPAAAARAGSGGAGQQTDDESEDEKDRELLDRLRGLGYVAWDDSATSSLKGVVRHEGGHPSPGYDFYGNDRDVFFLTDLDGKVVNAWRMPDQKNWCEHAELLPNGNLLAVCVGKSLTLLDWSSRVVWDLEIAAHHDAAALDDGGFMTLFIEKKEFQGYTVSFGGFATVSAKGEITSRWTVFDRREELERLHKPLNFEARPLRPDGGRGKKKDRDHYHINTLEVLKATPLGARDPRFRAGNIMLCLRNANLIVILDRETLSPVWHWGEGVLDLPHMPTMLPDGNILVFDNGTYRGYSRVLEIAPETEEIVWTYQGDPKKSFFSDWRGGNQRLENGDTLICEAQRGHVLEVSPAGKIVWEFWNPDMQGNKRRRIYRYTRYPVSMIEPLLEKLGGRQEPPPRKTARPAEPATDGG